MRKEVLPSLVEAEHLRNQGDILVLDGLNLMPDGKVEIVYIDAEQVIKNYFLDPGKPIGVQRGRFDRGIALLRQMIAHFTVLSSDERKSDGDRVKFNLKEKCFLTEAPCQVPSSLLFKMGLVPGDAISSTAKEVDQYEAEKAKGQEAPVKEREEEMNNVSWFIGENGSMGIKIRYKMRFANNLSWAGFENQRIADPKKREAHVKIIPVCTDSSQPYHFEREETYIFNFKEEEPLAHKLQPENERVKHEFDKIVSFHLHFPGSSGQFAPSNFEPFDLDLKEPGARAFNRLLVLATAPFVDYESYLEKRKKPTSGVL